MVATETFCLSIMNETVLAIARTVE